MKILFFAHGLNFLKTHLNSKEFENIRSTMQDNRLSA